VCALVRAQDPPGRFLESYKGFGFAVVDEATAVEKTCQALRDLKKYKAPAATTRRDTHNNNKNKNNIASPVPKPFASFAPTVLPPPPPLRDESSSSSSSSTGRGVVVPHVKRALGSRMAASVLWASSRVDVSDVLLGRGNGVSEHPGNTRFRAFCSSVRSEYYSASRYVYVCMYGWMDGCPSNIVGLWGGCFPNCTLSCFLTDTLCVCLCD
jgi:hypothetical protein